MPGEAAESAGIAATAPRAARADVGDVLVSVVVPVRDEGPNIAPLIAEIRAALAGIAYEIVYVDDGSGDDTPARLADAAAAAPPEAPLVRRRHRASCGQSAAIVTGVKAARGTWIATLDGDGQNDPADIPELLQRALTEEAAGGTVPVLVAGHRIRRRDSTLKRLGSRIANGVRARLLRDATPDTGCGAKVFRRAAFLDLPQFDHMHRFLPALFLRAGGRVVSVPVNHRPRRAGRSKYGTWDRLWVGLVDLIGVYWLQRRWRRPELEAPEPGWVPPSV